MKSLTTTIVLTLTVIAISLYVVSRSKSEHATIITHPASQSNASSPETARTPLGSVESMVGGLEQRLQQQPEDGKGWLLLAKSYRHMGRLEDAKQAYRKADSLGNGDPAVAAQLFGLESTAGNRISESKPNDMEASQ